MWKIFLLSSFGFLVILISPEASSADIFLLNDDFDTENSSIGLLDYSRFSNWIVTRGSVDLIGNGFYDFYPGNGLYVDLDGSTNEGGKLESKKKIYTFSRKLQATV
jgi:hypothetical protein